MLRSLFENTVENFLQPFERVFNRIAPVTLRSDYKPQTHIHTFPEGTSLEDQNKFLLRAERVCCEMGLKRNFHAIKDGEKIGSKFYFNTSEEYEKFVSSVFGDLYSVENFKQILRPGDNPQFLEDSQIAAENWLNERGIKYKVEICENELHFKFDRFSDRISFERFVEDGRIDKAIKDIKQNRLNQGIILGLN